VRYDRNSTNAEEKNQKHSPVFDQKWIGQLCLGLENGKKLVPAWSEGLSNGRLNWAVPFG